MRKEIARHLSSAGTIAWLAMVTPARAQGTAAAAEALFQQGRAELSEGKLESACSKLRQSDLLDPAPGTKLNLGECEAQRGRWATAWELFRAVEQKLDPSDARHPIAKSKRESLEPRLPRLEIVLKNNAPRETTVRVGSAVIGSTAFGIPLPLDPGTHTLLVLAPGRGEARLTVLLEEGRTTRIEVAPAALPPPAPVPTSAPPGPVRGPAAPRQAEAASDNSSLGYTFGGLGLAGLVIGGIAGGLTLDAKNTHDENCYPETRTCNAVGRDAASRGSTFGVVTTVGLAVGVVGIGLGTYFLLSSNQRGQHPQMGIAVRAESDGGRLTLVRHW